MSKRKQPKRSPHEPKLRLEDWLITSPENKAIWDQAVPVFEKAVPVVEKRIEAEDGASADSPASGAESAEHADYFGLNLAVVAKKPGRLRLAHKMQVEPRSLKDIAAMGIEIVNPDVHGDEYIIQDLVVRAILAREYAYFTHEIHFLPHGQEDRTTRDWFFDVLANDHLKRHWRDLWGGFQSWMLESGVRQGSSMESALSRNSPLTVNEAAEFLRVSRRSIYKFIEEEDLPAHRLTARGAYRFFPQELEAWLKREKPVYVEEDRLKISSKTTKKKNRPKSRKEHRGGPSKSTHSKEQKDD